MLSSRSSAGGTNAHMYSAPLREREQKTCTDGRIVVNGRTASQGKPKRADYLLRYRRDYTLAVVEAKAEYKSAADGIQQAREYAQILGLCFAYSTNGHTILEFDATTGIEQEV